MIKKPLILKETNVLGDVQDPLKLWIDGASRGNPGPSGAGALCEQGGKTIFGRACRLNDVTNNIAEYAALLVGLWQIHQLLFTKKMANEPGLSLRYRLMVFSDSQLLVRQMQGFYKIRNANLLRMACQAHKLLADFDYSFEHVMRECNVIADSLANQGVDAPNMPMPKFLHNLLIGSDGEFVDERTNLSLFD